jgi:hypothetical protein|tara:strand:- start:783 stop:1724 length:942 start_codon:yes stop_codon:yes gene_type:complete
MKIKIILLLILVTVLNSCSLGNKRYKRGFSNDILADKERLFSPEEMELLKNRNVVFFFKKNDTDEQRTNIEKAIREVWSFTPIEFAYYSERYNYPPDIYAYFTLERPIKTHYLSFYLSLTVNYQFENKRGYKKDRSINYCRIDMIPKVLTYKDYINKNTDIKEININNEVYNWNTAMLQTYLLDVNKHLKQNKRESIYKRFVYEEYLDALKNDTLFIPEYILEKRTPSMFEVIPDPKTLLSDYPYAYKVISTEELNNRFFTNKETYIFEHIISQNKKVIRIYNTEAGKIYQNNSSFYTGITSNDFTTIYYNNK